MGGIDVAGLTFFNGLSGRLEIELNEKPQPISPKLGNVAANPGSRLVSISLRMRVFEGGAFRDLKNEEWSRRVVRAPVIRMRSSRANSIIIEHAAPSSGTFTVRDVAAAVEETERRSRGASQWFGGIDVHHRFFEGIEDIGGIWEVHWGS